jgi:hypothetical protein
MTDPNTQIWLNCNGKTEGPFTEEDLAKMRANGDISKYSWIWDSESKGWMPIQPLPPPPAPGGPGAPSEAAAPPARHTGPAEFSLTPAEAIEDVDIEGKGKHHTPSKSFVRPFPTANAGTEVTRSIAVICHDNRNIVSGKVERMFGQGTSQETSITSADHKDSSPPFRKGGQVIINLLDEASGQLENAYAEIAELKKAPNGQWEYRLRWKALPKMLAGS